MMSLDVFVKLMLFIFPLCYSPGPGNVFFAVHGARFGFSRTLVSNVGYHVAVWLIGLAVGFALLKSLSGNPEFFTVMKYLGSAYLMYLAWGMFRAGAIDKATQPKTAGFFDGAILLTFNPKFYAVMLLLFTQFLVGEGEQTPLRVAQITTTLTVHSFASASLWALAGDLLLRKFRDDANARIMNMVFGLMILAVGVWVLLA